jgi:hypothetical protein
MLTTITGKTFHKPKVKAWEKEEVASLPAEVI